jgi:hypothetical protein
MAREVAFCAGALSIQLHEEIAVFKTPSTSVPYWILGIRQCLPLLALLLFSMSPAAAQSTWFSGMEHSSSGQAVLNASPNGESLEITGIGNSGEDGVVVQLGESQFIQFEFDDFDPELLPAGTAVTMEGRVQGATGTMESFGIITFAVTPNQDLSFSADYSPIGSNTYTALVLDQGTVVYTLSGIANGDCLLIESTGDPIPDPPPPPPKPYISIEEDPVLGVITKVCIVIIRKPIIFPGGATVIGDTIMFTPDAPSTVGTTLPTELALHVSGTPSLTLVKTSQQFSGVNVSGTGSAHVESYETTNGTLEVSNIGPSGLDGLSVDTANTSYDEIALSPATAIEPNPGAVIALRSLDDGGEERGSMRLEPNAAGQWEISAEFQGSDTYTMTVLDNGAIVYEASGLTGIGAATAGKAIGFCQNINVTDGGCILYGFLDGFYPITTNSGNTVTGNAIQFHNDTPISGCSTELVLGGANLPPFAVVNIWDGGGAENCFNGTDDDGDGLVDGDDPDCGCIPIDLPPITIGDPNGDGAINIADAINMLGYLFSGAALNCVAAMDVNGDNLADISDAIYELAFLFSLGPGPVGGPACTPDSTPPDPPLECESSGCP